MIQPGSVDNTSVSHAPSTPNTTVREYAVLRTPTGYLLSTNKQLSEVMPMAKAPIVTKIELTEFEYTLNNIAAEGTISIPVYKKGSTLQSRARVVRIFTD